MRRRPRSLMAFPSSKFDSKHIWKKRQTAFTWSEPMSVASLFGSFVNKLRRIWKGKYDKVVTIWRNQKQVMRLCFFMHIVLTMQIALYGSRFRMG